MSDVLSRIMAYKVEEVAASKGDVPYQELAARAREMPPARGFYRALSAKQAAGQFALIAEIKKASPSRGLIRADFDPAALARAYEAGGATCLSVLTDRPSFQGEPVYLGQAHGACSLPVLRKDFLFDPYQVLEARVWGADCILIIMAAVSDDQARALEEEALEQGLDVLVEVHAPRELARTEALSTRLIGINNRNLRTFETTLATSFDLAAQVDDNVLVVSESGISSHKDLKALQDHGISAALVGESLMRQNDVRLATERLLTGNPATSGEKPAHV